MAKVGDRAQRPDAQATRLAALAGDRSKGEQLALDGARQGAGQLERIALAAAEQATGPEGCWSDLDDTHVSRRLADAG